MSVSDEILQRIESGMSDPMDVTKRMLAREILRLRARLAEIERPLKFTEMRNRPAVIESPSNPTVEGIERADSPFVAPKCGTCGGSRRVPCHYSYQGCLSPGEYRTEGGQRVCDRHAQIANDISGLDSWLCLDNDCPECSKGGDR